MTVKFYSGWIQTLSPNLNSMKNYLSPLLNKVCSKVGSRSGCTNSQKIQNTKKHVILFVFRGTSHNLLERCKAKDATKVPLQYSVEWN